MELTSDLLRKIRALLAKTTENGATENEAILASTKVRELLDRYNLSITDVDNLGTQEPKIEVVSKNHRNAELQFPIWRSFIASGVSRYLNCSILRTKHGPLWIGTVEDITVCEELYDFIVQQIEIMKIGAIESAKNNGKQFSQGELLTFYKEYKLGVSTRIYYRFLELIEQRRKTNETESRALVIIDSAKDKAVSKLTNKLSGRGPKRKVNYNRSEAYYAGMSDGDKIAINKQIN